MRTKDLKIGMEVAVKTGLETATLGFIIAIGGWIKNRHLRFGGDRFLERQDGNRIGVVTRQGWTDYWWPELVRSADILMPWPEWEAEEAERLARQEAEWELAEKLEAEQMLKENQFIGKLDDLGIEGPCNPRQLTDAQIDFILALAARPSPPELWPHRDLSALLERMIEACDGSASKLLATLGAYLIESRILVPGLRGPVWARVHEQMMQLDKAVPWQARLVRIFNGSEPL